LSANRKRRPELLRQAVKINLGGINMSLGIKPMGSRVLIEREKPEEKTEGGIILTSAEKKEQPVAEVLAVGPGTKDEPMEVKVGDKVIFAQYGGTDIEYKGVKYTLMNQSDILAVIE
jgi:chaperonin GroES